MGNVVQAGTGQALPSCYFAGLPNTVACTTINKVCIRNEISNACSANNVVMPKSWLPAVWKT
jgi:hypothetical protein